MSLVKNGYKCIIAVNGNIAIREKYFKSLHFTPSMVIDTKLSKWHCFFLQALEGVLQPELKVDKSLVKKNTNITGLNADMSDPKHMFCLESLLSTLVFTADEYSELKLLLS